MPQVDQEPETPTTHGNAYWTLSGRLFFRGCLLSSTVVYQPNAQAVWWTVIAYLSLLATVR